MAERPISKCRRFKKNLRSPLGEKGLVLSSLNVVETFLRLRRANHAQHFSASRFTPAAVKVDADRIAFPDASGGEVLFLSLDSCQRQNELNCRCGRNSSIGDE